MEPTLQRSFRGQAGEISSVQFTSSRKHLVSGNAAGAVVLWPFRPSMRPLRLTTHDAAVHAVTVACPDGATGSSGLVASASKDRSVRISSSSST